MSKKLKKSNKSKMIAGVCGGIAEYFKIDPTIVRLIFVVLGFIHGSGFLIYVIAAIVMPSDFENLEKLNKSKVAIFGVGGVGGYVFEGLIRSGVGSIDVFDNDTVNITNINRQIIADHSTIGKKKVDVIKQRGLLINPNAIINTFDDFISTDAVASP